MPSRRRPHIWPVGSCVMSTSLEISVHWAPDEPRRLALTIHLRSMIELNDGIVAWRLQRRPCNILLQPCCFATALLDQRIIQHCCPSGTRTASLSALKTTGYGNKPTVILHREDGPQHATYRSGICVLLPSQGPVSRRCSGWNFLVSFRGLGSDDEFDFNLEGLEGGWGSVQTAHVSRRLWCFEVLNIQTLGSANAHPRGVGAARVMRYLYGLLILTGRPPVGVGIPDALTRGTLKSHSLYNIIKPKPSHKIPLN